MDIAQQMILFANVVNHGSFSATSRSLGLSPSAVSKQIGYLEDRLGIRLLNRSTRSISLTEEGSSFYDRCAEIASEVSEAEEFAVSLSARPQGTLRIAATVAFGKAQLLPILSGFLERHPDLEVVLELTDRGIDLTESDYDVAIRFTEQIEDTSVVACKLARNHRLVCAAPSYLAAHGAPLKLEDLAGHNCLRVSTVEHWNDWHFDVDQTEKTFHAMGNFKANSADAIYHATLAGLGIARLSTYLVAPDIQSGRLVHLLPECGEDESNIFALYPSRRNLSPKVRVFIDYLTEQFRPIPPWERSTAA